ncbi:hypothetical protein B0H16DRAFT_1708244 [Mycena metata]|uniref:N-acetyltransferase domain-containing protein n=1 Tax=Mycena metata TaxID=1033252 RepID=A0AAD7KHT6_9AGAR|nr:hypothetical protein B0H16DRAFT_1708244 [Mycena metata]
MKVIAGRSLLWLYAAHPTAGHPDCLDETHLQRSAGDGHARHPNALYCTRGGKPPSDADLTVEEEEPEEVLGYIALEYFPETDARTSEIRRMLVSQKHRRRGLTSRLILEVIPRREVEARANSLYSLLLTMPTHIVRLKPRPFLPDSFAPCGTEWLPFGLEYRPLFPWDSVPPSFKTEEREFECSTTLESHLLDFITLPVPTILPLDDPTDLCGLHARRCSSSEDEAFEKAMAFKKHVLDIMLDCYKKLP